jgi:hypothetical protein
VLARFRVGQCGSRRNGEVHLPAGTQVNLDLKVENDLLLIR